MAKLNIRYCSCGWSDQVALAEHKDQSDTISGCHNCLTAYIKKLEQALDESKERENALRLKFLELTKSESNKSLRNKIKELEERLKSKDS